MINTKLIDVEGENIPFIYDKEIVNGIFLGAIEHVDAHIKKFNITVTKANSKKEMGINFQKIGSTVFLTNHVKGNSDEFTIILAIFDYVDKMEVVNSDDFFLKGLFASVLDAIDLAQVITFGDLENVRLFKTK